MFQPSQHSCYQAVHSIYFHNVLSEHNKIPHLKVT